MRPDPTIPRIPYDPDKFNPGIKELLRQQEFYETPDPEKVFRAIEESHGNVFENGQWVRDVPYSQANWEGDGA